MTELIMNVGCPPPCYLDCNGDPLIDGRGNMIRPEDKFDMLMIYHYSQLIASRTKKIFHTQCQFIMNKYNFKIRGISKMKRSDIIRAVSRELF